MEAPGLGSIFKTIAEAPRGLVIVSGPTGSGKTTTLAALIDYLNETKRQHILAIEDPIEFVHDSKRWLKTQREGASRYTQFLGCAALNAVGVFAGCLS